MFRRLGLWAIGALCSGASIALLGASGASAPVDVEQRVTALLAQMTIEEKFGQLQQLDGHADGRYGPEHVDAAASRFR